LSPDSDVIASGVSEDRKDRIVLKDLYAGDFGLSSSSIELQYLVRRYPANIVVGAGLYRDKDRSVSDGITTDGKVISSDVYAYVLLDVLPRTFQLHFGMASSRLSDDVNKFYRTQVNPKLGAIWTPLDSTTIRAAAFRTVQRPLISDQTIEPTHIAGFNQFFDDLSGADTKQYGLAADHRISDYSKIGMEVTARQLTIAQQDFELNTLHHHWKEQLANLYWYRIIGSSTALTVGYEYERFSRPPGATGQEGIAELRAHLLPIGIRWFANERLSGNLTVTNVLQRGEFELFTSQEIISGRSRFTVVDAGLQYRLPARQGLVSIDAKNLFDRRFQFQESDATAHRLCPRRLVLVRWTMAFL
jgi:outer membrane receptor protein involved in Fe transport